MPSVNKPFANLGQFDAGLAQSLGVVALFMVDRPNSLVVDLVTGLTQAIGANASIVDTPEGPALHFTGSQILNFTHPAVDGVATGLVFTVVARIRPTAIQGSTQGIMFGVCNAGAVTGMSCVGWDSSTPPNTISYFIGSNGGNAATGKAAALNVFNTILSQRAVSLTTKVYTDGLQGGSGAATATASAPNVISFGGVARSSGTIRFGTGDLLWAALIKRDYTNTTDLITETQAWQLYATDFPYNLFRKSRKPWKGSGTSPVNVALTGISGTGSVGTLGLSFNVPLTGVVGTGSEGTLGVSLNRALTGVVGTGSVGTLGLSFNVPLTGVVGTGSEGTLTPTTGTSVALTGISGTGSVGTLGLSINVPMTGVVGTGSVGSLGSSRNITPSGISATGSLGTLGLSINRALTGVSGTGSLGSVTPSTAIFVALTGVTGTGSVGTLKPAVNVSLLGLTATGTLGVLSTTGGDIVVTVTGMQATGYLGRVLVWGVIPDGNTPGWVRIPGTQVPGWRPVNDSETPDWVDVVT